MAAARHHARRTLLVLFAGSTLTAEAAGQDPDSLRDPLRVTALTFVRLNARGFPELSVARRTGIALRVEDGSMPLGLPRDSLVELTDLTLQNSETNRCLSQEQSGSEVSDRAKCLLASFSWYIEVGEPSIDDDRARVEVHVYKAVPGRISGIDYAVYTVCFDRKGSIWRPQRLYCGIRRP